MQDFEAEILAIFLDEATESLAEWERCCFVLGKDDDENAVAQLFRCAHNMKGSARSVGLSELGKFIHVVEELILNLKQKTIVASPSTVKTLLRCEEMLRHWLENLRTDRTFQIDASLQAEITEEIVAASSGHSSPPVAAETLSLQIANATAGDIVFMENTVAIPTPPAARPQQPGAGASAESIRVPARRIDSLIQVVGELSIQSSIIEHAASQGSFDSQACKEAIALLGKLCRDLQTRSLGFRMQTLNSTMQRLERVARDVSSELAKEVDVVVEGVETELDKTVIERMMDPLVHMVRNALDHGVEATEERARSGKPPRAKMTLSARQELACRTSDPYEA